MWYVPPKKAQTSLRKCAALSEPLLVASMTVRTPGVLGRRGKGLFIFRKLGSTGNYFQGSGEQAHVFWDLGSPAKL